MEWRNAIASATPMAILTRVSQGNVSSSVERNMKPCMSSKVIYTGL